MTAPTPTVTLGDIIRGRRAALGLTQAEACQQLGVSRQTWHEWESSAAVKKVADARRLAEWLGLDEATVYATIAQGAA